MEKDTEELRSGGCAGVETYNRYGTLADETVAMREVAREPSPRAHKLRELYFDAKSSLSLEFTYWYNRRWSELEGDVNLARRGEALKAGFQHLTPSIYPGELLVMQRAGYLRGSYPMPWVSEGFFMPSDDALYQKALKEGVLAAGNATTLGTGGGNVTKSEGNVLSVAGKFGIRKEEYSILKEAAHRWSGKSTGAVGAKYERDVPGYEEKEAIMRSVLCMYDSGSAMPQGREVMNFYYPLQYGLGGLVQMCRDGIAASAGVADTDRLYFYKGALAALEGIQSWILHYADEAELLAEMEPDPKQRGEYEEIAARLHHLSVQRPHTFRDAVQLTWTMHLAVLNEDVVSGLSPGRLGQILYPYWKRDRDKGLITDEETIELLECMRVKFTALDVFGSPGLVGGVLSGNTFNNVCLGGLTKDGLSATNELELLFLEAGIRCATPQPTLSLLYDERLPEDLLLKGIECVKAGTGYPCWISNRTGVQFMVQNFAAEGMTVAEARAWALGGCLESSPGCWLPLELDGKVYDIPGGAGPSAGIGVNLLSLPKVLELVLNDGYDKVAGHRVFPPHGITLDSFDNVLAAVKFYVRRALDVLVRTNNVQMDAWAKVTPSIVNSLLKPDCLTRGLPIGSQGCRYNATFHVKVCGGVNLINSLASLKKNVFDDNTFMLEDYIAALDANFGYKDAKESGSFVMSGQLPGTHFAKFERIHRASLDAPKYGNDDSYVDSIMKEWQEWLCAVTHEYFSRYGKPLYLGGVSISTHGPQGYVTMATPDGRLAGTTFVDGSTSAYPGTDRNGPYALFESASVWDHSKQQSTQMNLKIHPSVVHGVAGARKFLDLIRGFLRKGNFHIQFNIVDSRMLRDAQKNPDKYRGLMVRVAGFTQYWAELGKQIQDEVISRTEYDEL